MRSESRQSSFRRYARLPFERLAASPFGRLTGHFLDRMVRGGGRDAASTEFEIGGGGLLGLLAAPGAFLSFLMIDKYSAFLSWFRGTRHQDLLLTSASDKFLFICVAMAVTGIVTVLKWDQIVPDSQDYLNLAPLPLRPRRILLANATAILTAVVLVAIDANAVPAVLFPGFVTSSMNAAVPVAMVFFLRFVAVHAVCVLLASFFSICAVFALLGTLSAVLPRDTFRACSSWVRGIVMVALIALLLSGFAGSTLLRHLVQAPDSALRYLPPFWYLGLYQGLQDRGPAAVTALAATGLRAAAAAFLLMVISYALSYRRTFASSAETARRPSRQRVVSLLLIVLDRFATHTPGFTRAFHRFATRAMFRDETHRLVIAVSLGLGYLVAVQDLSEDAALEAPLAAAYLLVLGLRIAFELPAAVSSGWVYRAVLDPRQTETFPVARRIMMSFMVPFILIPAAAVAAMQMGSFRTLVHAAWLAAISLCLIEIQLWGYRKLPLTCPLPGFRESLPVLCVVQFLGFQVFTRAGAGIERWVLANPWRLIWVPSVMAAAWYWKRRRLANAREAGEHEEGITFDNIPVRTVERLNLSDTA